MDRLQMAEQMRRALQMLATTLTDEKALEVANVFASWKSGRSYCAGDYVSYGVNSVGDPQLYKVLQSHRAQADWRPDLAVSLYVAVGLDAQGYPVWSQPAGAHDAYNVGDIVSYQGVHYQSLMDGNVYCPADDPAKWKKM